MYWPYLWLPSYPSWATTTCVARPFVFAGHVTAIVGVILCVDAAAVSAPGFAALMLPPLTKIVQQAAYYCNIAHELGVTQAALPQNPPAPLQTAKGTFNNAAALNVAVVVKRLFGVILGLWLIRLHDKREEWKC